MSRTLLPTALAILAAAALSACTDDAPTAAPDHSAHMAMSANARNGADIGTTGGWYDGKTITFHYNKPYFCSPTETMAKSGCVLGAEPTSAPRSGPIPVLYVTVPLFEGVDPGTLQCPDAGKCINHPNTIDLSRVFGPGTEDALLPPHSHVIGEKGAGWWEIEVVGVTSKAAWNQLVMGKSLEAVRQIQKDGGATGDIPTNLFLSFSANPSGM